MALTSPSSVRATVHSICQNSSLTQDWKCFKKCSLARFCSSSPLIIHPLSKIEKSYSLSDTFFLRYTSFPLGLNPTTPLINPKECELFLRVNVILIKSCINIHCMEYCHMPIGFPNKPLSEISQCKIDLDNQETSPVSKAIL